MVLPGRPGHADKRAQRTSQKPTGCPRTAAAQRTAPAGIFMPRWSPPGDAALIIVNARSGLLPAGGSRPRPAARLTARGGAPTLTAGTSMTDQADGAGLADRHGDVPVHRPGGQHPPARGAPGRLPGRRAPPPRPAPGRRGGARGVVFETVGDAVYAAFARPTDAVAAALAGQLALQREDWGGTGPLRARMGVHLGEVERQGAHYFGAPLYRCARLTATAHGGQVVLSAAVADGRPRRPAGGGGPARPGGAPAEGPGPAGAGGPTPAPGPARRSSRPCAAWTPGPTTSPARARPSSGGSAELAAVAERLRRPGRAPADPDRARRDRQDAAGPAGRRRGARRGRPEAGGPFPDGAWLVDLAPLADPALVPAAVAQALGVREAAGRPVGEALRDYLREKRLLLVLDNCEHLLPGAAPEAAALLEAGPGVTVPGHQPRAPAGGGRSTSTRCPRWACPLSGPDRARPARPGGPVPVRGGGPVRGAGGGRQAGLRRDQRHGAGGGGAVPPPGRAAPGARAGRGAGEGAPAPGAAGPPGRPPGGAHRGAPRRPGPAADAAGDPGLEPRPAGARRAGLLFARLAVFAGGLPLEGAEDVCAGGAVGPFDVLDLVTGLVDKSLVVAEPAWPGAALPPPGDRAPVRRGAAPPGGRGGRAARPAPGLVRRPGARGQRGRAGPGPRTVPRGVRAVHRRERQHPRRAGLGRHHAGRRRPRAGRRGRRHHGAAPVAGRDGALAGDAARRGPGPHPARARALLQLDFVRRVNHDFAGARIAVEEARAIAGEMGDEELAAGGGPARCWPPTWASTPARWRSWSGASPAPARGSWTGVVRFTRDLGGIFLAMGDFGRARAALTESRDVGLARELDPLPAAPPLPDHHRPPDRRPPRRARGPGGAGRGGGRSGRRWAPALPVQLPRARALGAGQPRPRRGPPR